MIERKMLLGILIVLLAVSCSAPQPAQLQATPNVTATRTRAERPTRAPEVAATATVAAAPTATATLPPSPMPTTPPSSTAKTGAPTAPLSSATPAPSAGPSTVAVAPKSSAAPAVASGASGVLLPLSPRKYPAPTLLTPDNNATYHVSQPVVHISWSAAPTDLMTFGQTAGCVSDATNFRRAFESYQLVIHSLDAARADQVQWTEDRAEFYFNLTTVPQGRYSWSVSVVTLCESYVVGQRAKTITRSLVAPASPTSATRTVNWIP